MPSSAQVTARSAARRTASIIVATMTVAAASSVMGARASEPAVFPENVRQVIPGPGDASVESDFLPDTARQATVDIKPANARAAQRFALLTEVVVLRAPMPRMTDARTQTLRCVYFNAQNGLAISSGPFRFSETQPTPHILALAECLRMAIALPGTQAADAARQRPTRCPRLQTSIAVTIRRIRFGVSGGVNGRPRTGTVPAPLVVTCQRTSGGLRLTFRSRDRASMLHQLVGPTLDFAFANYTVRAVPIRVRIAVS